MKNRYDKNAKQMILFHAFLIPVLKKFVKELTHLSEKEIEDILKATTPLSPKFHVSIHKKPVISLEVDVLFLLPIPKKKKIIIHIEIQDRWNFNELIERNYTYASAIYYRYVCNKHENMKIYNFWIILNTPRYLEGKVMHSTASFDFPTIKLPPHNSMIESYAIGLFNAHKNRKKEILACNDQCYVGLSVIFSDSIETAEKNDILKMKGYNLSEKESEMIKMSDGLLEGSIRYAEKRATKRATKRTEKRTTKNNYKIMMLVKSGKTNKEIKALYPHVPMKKIKELRNQFHDLVA